MAICQLRPSKKHLSHSNDTSPSQDNHPTTLVGNPLEFLRRGSPAHANGFKTQGVQQRHLVIKAFNAAQRRLLQEPSEVGMDARDDPKALPLTVHPLISPVFIFPELHPRFGLGNIPKQPRF